MAGFDSSYSERISRVVELLQGKWTVQILCAMRTGPVRLSELKREIPFASKRAHVEFWFPRSRWSNLGTRPEQFGIHVEYEILHIRCESPCWHS